MGRTWSGATAQPGRPPWATAVRQLLLLVALSIVLTAGRWAFVAPRLPLRADPAVYELELSAPLIEAALARRHYDEGIHLFIDTRADDIQVVDSVPGAFPVRPGSFDDDLLALLDVITPADRFVVFGDGNLTLANNVAARMIQRGYVNVELLKGGLAGWRAAGGPLSPRTQAATP